MNCYKKRVRDNELILIGEAFKHEDKSQWDRYEIYYPEFYSEDGDVIDVDYSYYECQGYVSFPTRGDSYDKLPNVRGLVGCNDMYYYDNFKT